MYNQVSILGTNKTASFAFLNERSRSFLLLSTWYYECSACIFDPDGPTPPRGTISAPPLFPRGRWPRNSDRRRYVVDKKKNTPQTSPRRVRNSLERRMAAAAAAAAAPPRIDRCPRYSHPRPHRRTALLLVPFRPTRT